MMASHSGGQAMPEDGPGLPDGARVITIERLLRDPQTGRRNRERSQRVLVDARAYGAYRPPAGDAGALLASRFDLSRLTERERGQLEALLEKARAGDGATGVTAADLAPRVR
jgi:hypothetical protein